MVAETHWAAQKERGAYLGIRLLFGFYRFGGNWLVRLSLVPVLVYFFVMGRSARRASLTFLRRVHAHTGPSPALPRRPGLVAGFRHFWQFANAAMDKLDVWAGKLDPDDLEYGEIGDFEEELQSGKGALLVASHLGNVEVSRALVRKKRSTRMNVLVFTRHAENFNRMLRMQNPEVEVNLIQATGVSPDLVIKLRECIERGECVVVVGDRIAVDAPDNVVWADFLGKPAPFAIGPWILASVLECPVYLLFCLKQGRGYRLTLVPFAKSIQVPRRRRQAVLQGIVDDYAAELADMASRYPFQWYNFYNFWHLPAEQVSKEKSR